ncbi:MAG: GLUG motif-containing protein [Bacteroidales bacterium]|nr:GLUG motif-containing protein [Bacteroidales bacterium]
MITGKESTRFGQKLPVRFPVWLLLFLMFNFSINHQAKAQFAGGTGTVQDPYQISNVTHLQNIRTAPNTAHFKLINNIDASATRTWNGGQGFNPVSYLNGNIDGNNFTITGLYINRTGSQVAMINHIGPGCMVKDLTLADIEVKGGSSAGTLAGVLSGKLLNVNVSGSVTGSVYTGGLAGEIYSNSSLQNCNANVTVSSTGQNSGGLIGYNIGATIKNCSSSGSVTCAGNAGGLIGRNDGNISDCSSSSSVAGTGNIVGGLIGFNNGGKITDCHSTGETSGGDNTGGLIGYNGYGTSSILNCYSTSDVNGNNNTGGLVGFNNGGKMTDCHSTGETSGGDNTGGLIGYNGYGSSSILNCHSTSDVDGNKNVGGLVGFNQDGTIDLTYSTGEVNGKSETGGLVGFMAYGSAKIKRSFSTSDVTGSNNNIGGLVGSLEQGTIENSYATGVASGNNKVGGLVGEMKWATVDRCYSTTLVNSNGGQKGGLIASRNGGSVNSSFWDKETSGQNSSDGGTPKTTVQMLDINTFTNAGWDFNSIWSIDPEINDGYPFLADLQGFFKIIWTGNLDIVWEKPGNWSNGAVPQANDKVRIPAVPNQPTISTAVTIKSINIQPNSVVTIAPKGSLSVSGTLNNMAGTSGLVVSSTAAGTGSLIHNTVGVPATFQRYIPGEAETWHILSSPMTDQPISGNFTPPGSYADGTGYDFFTWYEPDTSWVYLLNDSYPPTWLTANGNNNFLQGRGYMVEYQQQYPTLVFSGTLNNGEVSIPVTKTTGVGDLFGSNQLGNPYPSSIDWKAATGWSRTSLQQIAGGCSVWIWNDTAYNYGVYNSASIGDMGTLGITRYIAPTQGFFVQAAQSGNITMNNSIRVHNNASEWFKSTAQRHDQFFLTVISADGWGQDEILIGLDKREQASGSFKRFSFVKTAPALWIPDKGQFYSSLLFDSLTDHPVIPVAFRAGAAGSYRITSWFEKEMMQTAILIDKKTGQRIDLLETDEYLFQASPKDDAGRFVLQLQEGLFPDPHQPLPVRIFACNGILTIDLRLVEHPCAVKVFDPLGNLLLDQTIEGGEQTNFPMFARRGMFIVRIQNEQGKAINKIVL